MPHVIAETSDYLVLDKPAGIICHRDGRTIEPSVAEWLAQQYPETRGVGGSWVSPQGEVIPLCGLVHRLDRTTSGVLVVARTQALWDHLKTEFKERRVEKTYHALVYGHLQEEQGRIVAEIARSTVSPKRWYAKACEETHVRAAVTEWRLIARGVTPNGEAYSYLEMYPRTGRTHQIRVHLAFAGHPLIADHLYEPEQVPLLGFTRPALHARALSFVMPSGERVHYQAPLPSDFARVFSVGAIH
jgi:23S rRNA pseudouridine1911/1915/1917 synthase